MWLHTMHRALAPMPVEQSLQAHGVPLASFTSRSFLVMWTGENHRIQAFFKWLGPDLDLASMPVFHGRLSSDAGSGPRDAIC